MLSSRVEIFKGCKRRHKENFNLDQYIRDSLLDEMLLEFPESMSKLLRSGKLGKGIAKGAEMSRSLSRISPHSLRAEMWAQRKGYEENVFLVFKVCG